MAICSSISRLFGFSFRSKIPSLEIINSLVTTLMNQDNSVSFIQVNEYGTLARSFLFTKTCHNMNIIVQTTGGDAYSINGDSESPNKTLSNIIRDFLLKSSHKKYLWCFAYLYTIWLSHCLRLKILILINPKIQCHMLTRSESTLALWVCIESLPGFRC